MPFLDPRFGTLHQSLYNFLANSRDLLGMLDQLADGRTFLAVWRDAVAMDEAHRETCRLLHNYLASAGSLVAHTRRMLRDEHMSSDSVLAEYLAKIDREYANDPLDGFVQGLRNYTLHYDLPLTVAEMGGSVVDGKAGPDWSVGLYLDLKRLAGWPNWKGRAKRFQASAPPTFNLATLVRQHTARFQALHSWLLLRDREDRLRSAGIDPNSLIYPDNGVADPT